VQDALGVGFVDDFELAAFGDVGANFGLAGQKPWK